MNAILCKSCESSKTIKNGKVILKSGITKQKFRCKDCHYCFINSESGFERMMYEPKIVEAVIHLVCSGL